MSRRGSSRPLSGGGDGSAGPADQSVFGSSPSGRGKSANSKGKAYIYLNPFQVRLKPFCGGSVGSATEYMECMALTATQQLGVGAFPGAVMLQATCLRGLHPFFFTAKFICWNL